MIGSDCCGAYNPDFVDHSLCPECYEHCSFSEQDDWEEWCKSLPLALDFSFSKDVAHCVSETHKVWYEAFLSSTGLVCSTGTEDQQYVLQPHF